MGALSFVIIIVVVIGAIFLGTFFFFPGVIVKISERTARMRANLKEKKVQVDDHQWVYLEGGKGSETILMLHGFGLHKDFWGTMPIALSKSYRLVIPDLPGFGENTQIPSASYIVSPQAERLDRFVNTIGLDSFHIVGFSMGGGIGSVYASKYPSKVKSLLLLGAWGARPETLSEFFNLYKRGEIILAYKTAEEFDRILRYACYKDPKIPGPVMKHIAKLGAASYDFHQDVFVKSEEDIETTVESHLPNILAKTLIIHGADDRMIDVSCVKNWEKGIKDSKSIIIDKCGHTAFLDKPNEVIDAYKDFLSKL